MIDYVKNEVGGMYISSFPAVKLYRKVDGKLKLVDYRGDWTS